MANPYFQFKQFTIYHDQCGMKVTTDACLFGALMGKKNTTFVLDIGTGTGLLALMLAQRFPDMIIDALEIDQHAFQQALGNVQASPWKDRISISHQAVQSFRPEKQYDLIISNPPFFPDHLKSSDTQKNKALHTDTLPFTDLLKAIKRLLKPTGIFQVMLPPTQYQDFKKMAEHLDLRPFHEIRVFNKPNKPLFRVVAEMAFQSGSVSCLELFIADEQNRYTQSFKDLLQDYYLKPMD